MEDIFEAFIGAIYMDYDNNDDAVVLPSHMSFAPNTGAGYYVAEQWIISIMEKYLDFAELIQSRTNYKDMLVRHMQCSFQDAPRFFEVSIDTRGNRKVFKYCVKDRVSAVLGTGTGNTAKEAQNNAALEALKYYGISLLEQ